MLPISFFTRVIKALADEYKTRMDSIKVELEQIEKEIISASSGKS